MPGFYQSGEYDLAGFAVGAVKKDALIDGKTIKVGDVVLALKSSGVHSNGFSLVRKVCNGGGGGKRMGGKGGTPCALSGYTLAASLSLPSRPLLSCAQVIEKAMFPP